MRTRRLLLLGALPVTAALLAACSTGPGPLGDGGEPGWNQCVLGPEAHPVTMGIYTLDNSGSSPVTIQSVTLTAAHGLRITKSSWLIPVWIRERPFRWEIVGAGFPYPPTSWPTWRQRRPADGAVIPPHKTLNLVFGLIRTTPYRGRSAGAAITYTAGGTSYTVQEQTSLEVHPRGC